MADKQKQVEKVDHRAEAIDWLYTITLPFDEPPGIHVGMANAHASLAIAEQLERLNETLGGLASGGTDLRLKVRNG